MEKALLTRLDSICTRKNELEQSLANPEVIKNQQRFIEQSKELSELIPITECFEKIKKKSPPKITNKIKIKCVIKVRFAKNSYI